MLATVLSGASAELYGSLQSSYGTGYDNGAAAKYCSDFNVGYHREDMMPEKLMFCASHGARSHVRKDAAIAADAESAGRNANGRSKR